MLNFVRHSRGSPRHRKLTLVLTIYLLLAVLYSIIVPIGQGADEWAHYWYAQFIAGHGRLPANPTEREAAGYKSDWPPLYHLLAAAATGWIETDGPPTFKYLPDTPFGAGQIRRQLAASPLTDAILHTEDELFPWQQEILVWHLGRFLSIAFSLGTLLVTYQIALEVFARNGEAQEQGSSGVGKAYALRTTHYAPQTLALISTAFLAFIPRFLFTGMLFNYDSLTLLLASLFFWLALRVAKGYYPNWGFFALGGLAGLALMTKYLAALLPLEIVLLAFIKGSSKSSPLPPLSPAPLLKIGQAALAFLLVTGWWFGYLLFNFNEIGRYGPVLGLVAPLLRGDGSDRTVEQLFAWLSGGQAPPPAHIDQASHTLWQLVAGFFTSFWGNAVMLPYALDWFVWAMTLTAVVALVGGVIAWRTGLSSLLPHKVLLLLLLHSLLALPFMAIRLFGARDALEAVQGRHILFLSGPALIILLTRGLSQFTIHDSRFTIHNLRFTFLIGLTLSGAIGQLIYLNQIYPPPLPVRTTAYALDQAAASLVPVSLAEKATLMGQRVTPLNSAAWPFNPLASSSPASLKVDLFWQAGAEPALEDYLLELALVDEQGQTWADWLAYQTQASYPTRAWEKGDMIRDEGWLPVAGLPAGNYELRWRILGETGEVLPWQTLMTYPLPASASPGIEPAIWHKGQIATRPPLLHERQTAQFTFTDPRPPTPDPHLVGPDGVSRPPAAADKAWANFIIGPDWSPGDYRWQPEGEVVLRVRANERSFQLPAITHPLEADFAGEVKLLGYDLPIRRVQPGDGLPVTLYWQGLRWMGQDFVIFNRLLDNQGVAWGGYDRRAKENYSTLFWSPGEIVTDGFAVPVDAAAPPGVYYLSLGWYRQVEGQAESLALLDSATGQPAGSTSVTIGPIKVGDALPGITLTEAAPQTEINSVLGQQIKLLGFDLAGPEINASSGGDPSSSSSPPAFHPSNPLHLTLYWQALTTPDADFTVFVHIRSAAGQTVAQKDSPPAGGAYPTSLWAAGEIIKDEMVIPLDQIEPGSYKVVVGLYDFTTGARLTVPENPNNEINLAELAVAKP